MNKWFVMMLLPALLAGCASSEKKKAEVDTYFQLGVRYLNLNRLEVAKENLDRALAEDPDNVKVHNALAFLYEKIQKYPEAKVHYLKALQLAPEDISIQNNYGHFLCERAQFAEGMVFLNKALNNLLNDKQWMALTNAGLCQLGMGQQQKAKTYFKEALMVNSSYAPALLEMQKISYQNREYWAAKGYLQRYVQVAPQTAGSLWIAVQTERALGNNGLADEYHNELLEKFPFSNEAKQLGPAPQ